MDIKKFIKERKKILLILLLILLFGLFTGIYVAKRQNSAKKNSKQNETIKEQNAKTPEKKKRLFKINDTSKKNVTAIKKKRMTIIDQHTNVIDNTVPRDINLSSNTSISKSSGKSPKSNIVYFVEFYDKGSGTNTWVAKKVTNKSSVRKKVDDDSIVSEGGDTEYKRITNK